MRIASQNSLSLASAPRGGDVGLSSFLAAALVFLVISWSPFHYWDEFYYLFSALAHTPHELLAVDPSGDLFPAGFFAGKIGHLVLSGSLLRCSALAGPRSSYYRVPTPS